MNEEGEKMSKGTFNLFAVAKALTFVTSLAAILYVFISGYMLDPFRWRLNDGLSFLFFWPFLMTVQIFYGFFLFGFLISIIMGILVLVIGCSHKKKKKNNGYIIADFSFNIVDALANMILFAVILFVLMHLRPTASMIYIAWLVVRIAINVLGFLAFGRQMQEKRKAEDRKCQQSRNNNFNNASYPQYPPPGYPYSPPWQWQPPQWQPQQGQPPQWQPQQGQQPQSQPIQAPPPQGQPPQWQPQQGQQPQSQPIQAPPQTQDLPLFKQQDNKPE